MLSIQELHTSTVKELQQELESARLELFRIHMGTKTKHLKDTSLIPKYKRYIAQVLTMLHQTQAEGKAKESNPTEAKKEVKTEAPATETAPAKKSTKKASVKAVKKVMKQVSKK